MGRVSPETLNISHKANPPIGKSGGCSFAKHIRIINMTVQIIEVRISDFLLYFSHNQQTTAMDVTFISVM